MRMWDGPRRPRRLKWTSRLYRDWDGPRVWDLRWTSQTSHIEIEMDLADLLECSICLEQVNFWYFYRFEKDQVLRLPRIWIFWRFLRIWKRKNWMIFSQLDESNKVLPCQHTFCTKCLKVRTCPDMETKMTKSCWIRTSMYQKKKRPKLTKMLAQDIYQKKSELLCPECRKPVEVAIDSLPPNILANRILEVIKLKSRCFICH